MLWGDRRDECHASSVTFSLSTLLSQFAKRTNVPGSSRESSRESSGVSQPVATISEETSKETRTTDVAASSSSVTGVSSEGPAAPASAGPDESGRPPSFTRELEDEGFEGVEMVVSTDEIAADYLQYVESLQAGFKQQQQQTGEDGKKKKKGVKAFVSGQ